MVSRTRMFRQRAGPDTWLSLVRCVLFRVGVSSTYQGLNDRWDVRGRLGRN